MVKLLDRYITGKLILLIGLVGLFLYLQSQLLFILGMALITATFLFFEYRLKKNLISTNKGILDQDNRQIIQLLQQYKVIYPLNHIVAIIWIGIWIYLLRNDGYNLFFNSNLWFVVVGILIFFPVYEGTKEVYREIDREVEFYKT